ncbi:MAG: respiratory nitrate reductase subunit gamma [Desulfobacterota bacterium]|nr:respiratory nitrate reductase subunit gamma [Thermodesulfobacteriota bacterium]
MDLAYELAFVVFPYLCLAVFVVGHAYRYRSDRYGWNAQSSEFLEKNSLFYGSVFFHFGIVLTLLGHAGGLLIPQALYDIAGIRSETHLAIAYWMGLLVGAAALAGALLLLRRRITHSRLRATSTVNDAITLGALVVVIGAGMYNVLFGHHNVLYTVAPWIRGVLTFTPDPGLMRQVPISYKVHVLSALALLGFSPFSRLVHVWSAPLGYLFRKLLIFRRDEEGTNRGEVPCRPIPGSEVQ